MLSASAYALFNEAAFSGAQTSNHLYQNQVLIPFDFLENNPATLNILLRPGFAWQICDVPMVIYYILPLRHASPAETADYRSWPLL